MADTNVTIPEGIKFVRNETLTGMADTIRSLTGTTGALTPAQMQSGLTTVKTNIDNAFTALAAKGATVPEGATIADLVAAAESVPDAGSGGGSGGASIGVCTVYLVIPAQCSLFGGYTTFENGVVSTKLTHEAPYDVIKSASGALLNFKYTLANVVCGSAITCGDPNYAVEGNTIISGDATLLETLTYGDPAFIIQTPTTAGSVATITIT